MNTLCTLALVLLMDVSASVTQENYQLQMQGLVAAFTSPQMQQTLLAQPDGVAITLIQWASDAETVVPWMHLRNQTQLDQFVTRLSEQVRAEPGYQTAVGEALAAGMRALEQAPCEAEQRMIDISGDGINNLGAEPQALRDLAQHMLIQINALAIVTDNEPNIHQWYRENVITPDGFVIVAQGHEDFGRAIRRKLLLEISQR